MTNSRSLQVLCHFHYPHLKIVSLTIEINLTNGSGGALHPLWSIPAPIFSTTRDGGAPWRRTKAAMLMPSSGDGVRRHLRREHGFQLPLHPLQVSGWLTITVLTAGTFLVLVPALPITLQSAAVAAVSTPLLLHLAAHVAAAVVDPVEPALRKRQPEPLPELDRKKHAHVIEGGVCHLCGIHTVRTMVVKKSFIDASSFWRHGTVLFLF